MTTNSERLRQAMEAVSRGDVERFGDILLAEDVVWHWPGRSAVSGDYRGREKVLELIRGFGQMTQNTLRIEPLEILEGRDYLMSFTHATADQGDRRFDGVMADAMRFNAEGRVEEFWTLSNEQEALDEFIG